MLDRALKEEVGVFLRFLSNEDRRAYYLRAYSEAKAFPRFSALSFHHRGPDTLWIKRNPSDPDIAIEDEDF